MSVARKELLEAAAPQDHFVQLYAADDHMLAVNVGLYLYEGLIAGTPGVVIATADNRNRILGELRRLGIRTGDVLADGLLSMLDAEETLSRFLVGGYPDASLFDASVGEVVRSKIDESNGAGLRAYGEMVGVLWSNGEYPSAIRLEQLWNKLREAIPFNLFCGYPIDVFANHFDATLVTSLLCAHTHLLPAGPDGNLEDAVARAMDEVLGQKVRQLRPEATLPKDCAALPKAEATILWLRSNLPEKADAILDLARTYYYAASPA